MRPHSAKKFSNLDSSLTLSLPPVKWFAISSFKVSLVISVKEPSWLIRNSGVHGFLKISVYHCDIRYSLPNLHRLSSMISFSLFACDFKSIKIFIIMILHCSVHFIVRIDNQNCNLILWNVISFYLQIQIPKFIFAFLFGKKKNMIFTIDSCYPRE